MEKLLTLNTLREFIRRFKAQCQQGKDASLLNCTYEFEYSLDPDGEQWLSMTEEEFWENPDDGPRPGWYNARCLTDRPVERVVWEKRAVHYTKDQGLQRSTESSTGHIAAWSRAHVIQTDGLLAEIGRLRRNVAAAEERERQARADSQAATDALLEVKRERLAMQIERDEAVVAREEAERLAEVAKEELEALEERGGEFAEPAQKAMGTAIDRIFENLGFTPEDLPAAVREAIEEIAIWVVSQHGIWPVLVEEGLSYDAVRLLLRHSGMDPGEQPPPAGAEPWWVKEEPEPQPAQAEEPH